MVIDKFTGDYFFLSNYYRVSFDVDGITYLNSEAAFHAYKSTNIGVRKVFGNLSPSIAKHFGRQIELRPDWEDIKLDIMRKVVDAKFSQNPNLRTALLRTGDAMLVEGNTWGDKFWGVCDGTGENHLGQILMELRDQYRKEDAA